MSEATANQRPHGHVTPNADGYLARCGGPNICKVCMQELAALKQSISDEREAFQRDVELAGIGFMVDGMRVSPDRVTVQYANSARLGNAVVMPERCEYCENLSRATDYYRSMLRAVLKDIRDEIPRGGLPPSWDDIADSISITLNQTSFDSLNPSRGVPEGMVAVTQHDANNYCLILTALGMEEEGDPVAEVKRLLSAPSHGEQVREVAQVSAVGQVAYVGDGELGIEWLLEGGICELIPGQLLLISDNPITDDEGYGEVYAATPTPAPVEPAHSDLIVPCELLLRTLYNDNPSDADYLAMCALLNGGRS